MVIWYGLAGLQASAHALRENGQRNTRKATMQIHLTEPLREAA